MSSKVRDYYNNYIDFKKRNEIVNEKLDRVSKRYKIKDIFDDKELSKLPNIIRFHWLNKWKQERADNLSSMERIRFRLPKEKGFSWDDYDFNFDGDDYEYDTDENLRIEYNDLMNKLDDLNNVCKDKVFNPLTYDGVNGNSPEMEENLNRYVIEKVGDLDVFQVAKRAWLLKEMGSHDKAFDYFKKHVVKAKQASDRARERFNNALERWKKGEIKYFRYKRNKNWYK